MHFGRYGHLFGLAALVAIVFDARGRAMAETKYGGPDFNRDVFPILSDACLPCHGPDVAKRRAGLRLDMEAALFAVQSGSAPVVPGHPERSEIVLRMRNADPNERMPPADAPRQLSRGEVKTIEDWIRHGAKWQGHWAYQRPMVPKIPQVKNRAWPRDPIDNFVLSRIEHERLAPTNDADADALVRRLSLSLTGLPPTVGSVDRFVADYQHHPEAAVASEVDRLLAQPEYAEHLTAHWLAAARFADTNGYQKDDERHMWRWRDWVLRAFSTNMPYDKFTVLQTAGDLLPDATVDDQIATGFHRNHRSNSEGGIIDEEFRQEYIADRVDTMSTVWLGVTMGCARCHDHKYDPFTQKDYYQLAAFFSSVPERGRIVGKGNAIPTLVAPTHEQSIRLQELRTALSRARKALLDMTPAIEARVSRWIPHDENDEDFLRRGLLVRLENGGRSFKGKWQLGLNSTGALSGDRPFTVAVLGAFAPKCGFEIGQQEPDAEGKGWAFSWTRDQLRASLVSRRIDDGIRVASERIAARPNHLVALTYDGNRLASGVGARVDGARIALQAELDSFVNDAATNTPMVFREHGDCNAAGATEIRIYDRVLSEDEIGWLAEPTPLSTLARQRSLSTVSKAKLVAAWLEVASDGAQKSTWQTFVEADEALSRFEHELPTSMVLSEGAYRDTHILLRGAYDHPLQAVDPDIPHLWAAPRNGPKLNRLDLARWLVSRDNPLTARVFVNRMWQMVFGTGLVPTSENLGVQGQRPTHPELLDHLAISFIESGWDIKHLIKRLTISRTFRQASRLNPPGIQSDPENRYFTRALRLRLPAEVIRDQALAVSGLLHRQVGGPSVKLPQPEGVWEDNGGPTFVAAVGSQRYRRSLYAYWKRTAPPPTLTTFDAGTRDACSVRQDTTNTPLQALALMNDPVYLDAARALVSLLVPKAGPPLSPDTFAREVIRRSLTRPATAQERHATRQYWLQEVKALSREPHRAGQILGEPDGASEGVRRLIERAASVLTVLMVFNLDEMITRE